ncbi:MAG: hypothetical protein ACI9TH_003913, partial [Kiritimatiellia bacterium]
MLLPGMKTEVVFQSKTSGKIDLPRSISVFPLLPMKLPVSHLLKPLAFRPDIEQSVKVGANGNI